MPWRGLTETKEGRLVVIAVVGGTLMIAAALGNLMAAGAADRAASSAREALRRDLVTVTDEMIDAYPSSQDAIERRAVRALTGQGARVLGSARLDEEVVVAVEAGFAWQVRCVEVELRGDATVLTYVHARSC